MRSTFVELRPRRAELCLQAIGELDQQRVGHADQRSGAPIAGMASKSHAVLTGEMELAAKALARGRFARAG